MQSAPQLLVRLLFLNFSEIFFFFFFSTAGAETKEQVCGPADKPMSLQGQKGELSSASTECVVPKTRLMETERVYFRGGSRVKWIRG